MVIHMPDHCGKDNLKKQNVATGMGESTELRMPICAPTARSMAICIRLCMSVHVDDIKLSWEGKTGRGSSVGTWFEKKYRIGNICLFIENWDYSCQYTWMTSKMAGKKAEYGHHVEEIDETGRSWRTNVIS